MKTLIAVLIAAVLALPAAVLVTLAVLINPAAVSCASGSFTLVDIPNSLTAHTRGGDVVTLDYRQLSHAATIITVGSQTGSVGKSGVVVALMAALTESSLRLLSNVDAYPESASFLNDGDGSDHDSLGLFQMRPSTGWGTVAELMDATYEARAFFGGSSGPNGGSPRGLLDIPGWTGLTPGEAAQAVEVSAYPDRYDDMQPVAESVLAALTTARTDLPPGASQSETTRIVFPLPKGAYATGSGFGWRTDPFTGARSFHYGTDYPAAAGTPILSMTDGIVEFAGMTSGFGGLVIIESTVDGTRVVFYYAHMWSDGIHASKGDHVTAGQHIGDVGSAGRSTGAHLHLEVHPRGSAHPAADAAMWLRNHRAIGLEAADAQISLCENAANS